MSVCATGRVVAAASACVGWWVVRHVWQVKPLHFTFATCAHPPSLAERAQARPAAAAHGPWPVWVVVCVLDSVLFVAWDGGPAQTQQREAKSSLLGGVKTESQSF